MSYTVSELLLCNLRDVFGENDPARRRAAINELYNEECVFYDPNKGAHRGRDAIDRIAGVRRKWNSIKLVIVDASDRGRGSRIIVVVRPKWFVGGRPSVSVCRWYRRPSWCGITRIRWSLITNPDPVNRLATVWVDTPLKNNPANASAIDRRNILSGRNVGSGSCVRTRPIWL